MSQVNNNAESLNRELRKFKNLKSVDYKGLLSGIPESFVNLYRFLFCENNIGFSQFVIDKGYDLSGLNDYKFMEAVYRMMRDLLNAKPPINQNQFFSSGFTQRKLEMSTIIAAEVRKITNEIINKTGKKSVQTPSLMKSSLRRCNSAQKQTRIIEMGDESDSGKHKNQFKVFNKVKSVDKYHNNNTNVIERSHKGMPYVDNSRSSDQLSDESDVVESYISQAIPKENIIGNHYVNPKILVEKADTTSNSNAQNRISENISRNNYDNYQSIKDNQKYSSALNYQKPIDPGDMSAFESNVGDNNKYNDFNNRNAHHERLYDMKHYAPSQHNESLIYDKERQFPGWEKIMQQFDTVLARITLLEGRMNRIEIKLEHSNNTADNYHHGTSLYQGHGNQSNSEFISSNNQNGISKSNAYFSKNNNFMSGAKEAIPDFESNHQHLRTKLDSDRSHSSSTYSTNYKHHIPNDYNNYSDPRYVTNFTNYSDKKNHDVLNHNGAKEDYPSLSATFTSCPSQGSQKNGSIDPEKEYYQPMSNNFKSSKPTNKVLNGIPPLHPKTTNKFEESGYYKDASYGKQSEERVLSQTDRIASMLSDTQKMLRLSDEEL